MQWYKSQLRKDIEKMLVNQAGLEADVVLLTNAVTLLGQNIATLEGLITSGEGAPTVAQLDDTSLQAAITQLGTINTAITAFLAGQPATVTSANFNIGGAAAKPATQVADSIKPLVK